MGKEYSDFVIKSFKDMKKARNIKNKKHNQIVNDYDKIKSRHLDKLAKKC